MFWKRMMERYGSEREYNRALISGFKFGERPEIMIVVDKLLTGLDAPRNTVLYLAKSLKEHGLLQAIARVNRLYEGKDFGYIIDYYGVLGERHEALQSYGALAGYDAEDLQGTLTDIDEEVRRLPQRHSDLWEVFKEIRQRKDEEAYEQWLGDEERRDRFYERLSLYSRTLGIAFSTVRFIAQTPAEKLGRYKRDLAFFQKLRASVKQRYAEEIDFKEYEARVRKLIDTHIASTEVIAITPPVNIFDKERFAAEVEKLQTAASKADTIAHRTKKTIEERMGEDPFFYRRFSKILTEVIEAWREKRISDAEYLQQVIEVMNAVRERRGDDLPPELEGRESAKAFYGVVNEVLDRLMAGSAEARKAAAAAALEIDRIIETAKVVDWANNLDAQNEMRNRIDDYLYSLREERGLELNFDEMDRIIDQSLGIARARRA